MYSLFIGIDVSKHWIDVAYLSNGKVIYLGQYDNTISGFKKFVKALSKLMTNPACEWLVGFENTGDYSKALLSWLYSQGVACKEFCPLALSKSKGIKRGSTDKIDAQFIARYIYEKRDTIALSKPTNASICRLKKLLSRRKLLVKQRKALQTSLKEQKSEIDMIDYEVFEEDNRQLIDLYQNQIEEIEQKIKQLISQDAEMYSNYQLLLSIIGIGPIIAAYLIGFTDNFKRFPDARKFASYIGIAPFCSKQSGTSIKGVNRVSQMANKTIKGLLSNGANAAIVHDKELRWYYNKKRTEGKEYGTAINAVKNKLIARAFAVVKRQTPYVPLMNYT